MITLTKSNVPNFLQESDFYLSTEDENEEFSIPTDCFKKDVTVDNDNDLALLLSTLRFWGASVLPLAVIRYVTWRRPQEVLSALPPHGADVPHLRFLESLCRELHQSGGAQVDTKHRGIKLLGRSNDLQYDVARLVRAQYELHDGNIWNEGTCALAASFKRVDVLRSLHESGCPWDATTCNSAARSGSLACLKYAHAHGCPLDSDICVNACKGYSAECLQYAHEHGCAFGDAYAYTTEGFPCARYIKANGGRVLTVKLCKEAVKRRDLSLLMRLHEEGCPWDESTCREAARIGSLACLRFAHQHGCPWDDGAMLLAAGGKDLACLRYMHEQQHPWSAGVCVAAAEAGSLPCLLYAHENGCFWDAATVNIAARNGHVACLHYALLEKCPTDADTSPSAAVSSVRCLALVLQYGYRCDERSCAAAAGANNLECLKYLLEQDCPWDSSTSRAAVASGSLACLQYAHRHRCPWEADIAHVAVTNGSLACLQYLHSQGCAWEPSLLLRVPLTVRTRKCLEYVQDHPDAVVAPIALPTEVTERDGERCDEGDEDNHGRSDHDHPLKRQRLCG
jgi:hypothetical protein